MNAFNPILIDPFPEFSKTLAAGFSTRVGGHSVGNYSELNLSFKSGDDLNRVNQNLDLIREKMNVIGKKLFYPQLEHGDQLIEAGALDKPADAIFTQATNCIIAVTMADCLAALIYDPKRKTIAAVHAGWRGTRLEILRKTITTLAQQDLINPRDSYVALSPCLRLNSLEMGQAVADKLDARFVEKREAKYFFDMAGCNREQALEAGIEVEHLRDMGGDTLSEPEKYFSFRRQGAASGRMAAFIALR